MRMGAAHDCDSFSACESVPPVYALEAPRPLRCSAGGPVTNSRLCSALRRIAKGGPLYPLELQLCGTASVSTVPFTAAHLTSNCGREGRV